MLCVFTDNDILCQDFYLHVRLAINSILLDLQLMINFTPGIFRWTEHGLSTGTQYHLYEKEKKLWDTGRRNKYFVNKRYLDLKNLNREKLKSALT